METFVTGGPGVGHPCRRRPGRGRSGQRHRRRASPTGPDRQRPAAAALTKKQVRKIAKKVAKREIRKAAPTLSVAHASPATARPGPARRTTRYRDYRGERQLDQSLRGQRPRPGRPRPPPATLTTRAWRMTTTPAHHLRDSTTRLHHCRQEGGHGAQVRRPAGRETTPKRASGGGPAGEARLCSRTTVAGGGRRGDRGPYDDSHRDLRGRPDLDRPGGRAGRVQPHPGRQIARTHGAAWACGGNATVSTLHGLRETRAQGRRRERQRERHVVGGNRYERPNLCQVTGRYVLLAGRSHPCPALLVRGPGRGTRAASDAGACRQ